MPQFDTTHRVNHAAHQMFDLVADVENYPEFVPLCQSLTVRNRRQKGEREIVLANMSVGYKAIREAVTTQVILDRLALEIRTSYVDGPFEHLCNVWRFIPVTEQSCDVFFSIDYAFKSRALGLLMGSMFDRAFAKFSEAFEARADLIYGDATPVA